MPALGAGDLTAIRGRPVGRLWRLYVYQPVEVWEGEVGGAPERGDTTLQVTTVAGNPANILAHSTVWILDNADDPKDYPSKVRAKDYTAGPPNYLDVAENGIDWAVGDKLFAMRLFELWPRIPYIDASDPDNPILYMDSDIAYTDDDTAQPPKANAGPAAIGDLVGGQCDLVFADAGSFTVPTGGAVSSHQWAAIGGSPAVVAGAENTSTVTYRYTTAGYYYVSLTVTDGNGKSAIRYVPVIVDDGTLSIDGVVPGDRYWDNHGWVLSRRLLGIDADAGDFFDGAPVFLVADDTQVADGAFAANRSNLRWSGWLMEDTARRTALNRVNEYRAVSSTHVLANIPAFPTGIYSGSPPGGCGAPCYWYYYSGLCIDSVIFLVLHWHSTTTFVCDWHATGEWANRLRPGEELTSDDLLSQVNYVLAAVIGDLRCDRQGVLRSMRDEWHLSAAEQAARATVLTLATTDFQEARYGPRPHRAKVREVRALGVDAAGEPYMSGAPGPAPLDGGRPLEFPKLAPDDQDELNQWAGQHLAFVNWAVPLVLRMSGEYDAVDPALGEYVAGTLSTYDSELPDGPFAVRGVRFTDDHSRLATIGEWELEPTPGQYGADTRQIPTDPPAPDPPDLPDEYEPPIPEFWPTCVYFAGDTGGVYYTASFSGPDVATQPVWVALGTAGAWPAGNRLRSFGISKLLPDGDVIALTYDAAGSREIITYNWTTAAWANSLTDANIRAAGPLFCQADAYLVDMQVDKDTGEVYAFGVGSQAFAIYKKTSVEGGSWSMVYQVNKGASFRGTSKNFWVYGDHIAFIIQDGIFTPKFILYYSTNGGAAWNTDILQDQAVVYSPTVAFPCNNTGRVFRNYLGHEMSYHDMGAADYSLTWCMAQIACWHWNSGRPDTFHPDYRVAAAIRFVEDQAGVNDANHLYQTTDDFVTYYDWGEIWIGLGVASTPRDVNSIADMVNLNDWNMIIYGAGDAFAGNPHTIFAAYGSADLNPMGKAGDNCDAAPYNDSIPYTCLGPCWRGIQVVF